MENLRCVQEKDKSERKEEIIEQDKSDERIDIYKSESCTGLTKQSKESFVGKSRKKHCDWMKSTSHIYSSNIKLSKSYHAHQKTYDRLKKYIKDEPEICNLPQKCEASSSSTTALKKKQNIIPSKDYYTSLCQKRAEFRMHLIRKIKGPMKCKSRHEDKMEICSDYAKECMILDDGDVCGQTTLSDVDDIGDIWLTEEDKNLLRYYYYILHDVDDIHAGTLDSDTLKKITSMVSAKWQKKHNKCFNQLIRELKSDYVANMKKSLVDFVLQEPFEEEVFVPPLLSREIAELFSLEHCIKCKKRRAKLEERSIMLYHPCIRKIVNLWYREYGLVN
ncbi:PREDICTED: uncharacterized protein LOC105149142 [Acromyrmex echinatior]|uniref:uncharacterized protein LOC105149142 n=1 Tax=Acromyrmex echinatior TaxID=103372 RepID=UPI000580D147|nr:PREDICTED: uncharacterized protein LOC105149142 [Acromyrmex echinatior]